MIYLSFLGLAVLLILFLDGAVLIEITRRLVEPALSSKNSRKMAVAADRWPDWVGGSKKPLKIRTFEADSTSTESCHGRWRLAPRGNSGCVRWDSLRGVMFVGRVCLWMFSVEVFAANVNVGLSTWQVWEQAVVVRWKAFKVVSRLQLSSILIIITTINKLCKLTISSYLFVRWHLFRHVGYLRHQQQVDLLT